MYNRQNMSPEEVESMIYQEGEEEFKRVYDSMRPYVVDRMDAFEAANKARQEKKKNLRAIYGR